MRGGAIQQPIQFERMTLKGLDRQHPDGDADGDANGRHDDALRPAGPCPAPLPLPPDDGHASFSPPSVTRRHEACLSAQCQQGAVSIAT